MRIQTKKDQEEQAKRNLEKMRNKFYIRSTEFWKFWKFRAECEGKRQREKYDTVDEQGNIINDPEKAKVFEHIATYYI